MASVCDGPSSPHFWPLPFKGRAAFPPLPAAGLAGVSAEMAATLGGRPRAAEGHAARRRAGQHPAGGRIAYLDTIGTRADDRAYKRMRLALASAHREMHNRLHQQGAYHEHTPAAGHGAH